MKGEGEAARILDDGVLGVCVWRCVCVCGGWMCVCGGVVGIDELLVWYNLSAESTYQIPPISTYKPEEARHACTDHYKFSAFGLDVIT